MKPILSALLSVSTTQLTDAEKKLFSRINPLGVCLFKRNIRDKDQLRALTREISQTIGRENVLIATDQEGGRVCRLEPPLVQRYAAAASLGSLPSDERDKACRLHARLIAHDLRAFGINWNLAPCLDVASEKTHPVLKSRCFSSDKNIVYACGKTMITTYLEQSVLPCMKHMPGHGRAQVDPHLKLPVLPFSLTELEEDFFPFIRLADQAPCAMTAHIVLPEIDTSPVTQSEKGIRFIREKIDFQGFLISDALEMKALSGSLGEKTKRALAAGCDAVCYCRGDIGEMQEVAENAGFLSNDALERLDKMHAVLTRPPLAFDRVAARREYDRILAKLPSLEHDYDAVETLNAMR